MSFKFNIKYKDYITLANLQFTIDNKTYEFNNLQVYTPDCDDCINNINAHYFIYEIINDYGAIQRYTEYVNCFEGLVFNPNKLKLFNINIDNKNDFRELFLIINKNIKGKIKHHFNIKMINMI